MSLLSRLAVQAARAYGILSAADKNKVVADFLVVAGGGGGGDDLGGAGGAGGFRTSAGTSGGGASAEATLTLSNLNTYSILVGAGGAGATSGGVVGTNGGDSSISGTGITTITSLGGGGGAGDGGGSGVGTPNSGGSGGGAASGSGRSGAAGTAGQGYAGGTNPSGSYIGASAGGGGAGAAGTGRSGSSIIGGNGGNGVQSSISGTATYYAGGGAGGTGTSGTAGTAGLGGGGTGATGSGNNGGNGGTNLGGGGGGGSAAGGNGGSGGSGVVIISYTSATPKFVGGTITTSGGKQIHTFTSSGTLSPITPITASYLVVAGGGGAGSGGGGGGAGGLLTSSTTLYSGATYVVTVGAGGNGGAGGSSNNGVQGSNSVLSGTGLTTVTSIGGGFGNGSGSGSGGSGGSGGGGRGAGQNPGGAGGAGTAGQGNNGGAGFWPSPFDSGGGGGAGAVGTSATAGGAAPNGGVGLSSSITGTATFYAGGGGGSPTLGTVGLGGAGGGGNAATNGSTRAGSPGTANTGGGGGGGDSSGASFAGGAGGSGIVIISYAGSQAFNGGLVTSSGGNTIHTFTSTGALTPLTNNLTNSLRFRSSASAYLSRTFASTGTNNKIQTFSAWVKRGLLSSSANYRLMGCYNGSSSYSTEINFSNDSFRIEFGGSAAYELKTTQVFRDPSAWYHFVIAIDTTQATAANRIKMYVNGNQITAFATANYPAQNDSSQLGSATANNKIGANWNTSGAAEYFDGYMTDINFIDGQALEPYYFGNNDANGVWKPIQYKGTYGTNGFYLTFGNTTSTTTLGYDSSPNGNNWTCNNISLTAGTTYDAMTDVPTNTSATVANYCVLNPLVASTTATITGANLNATGSTTTFANARATFTLSSGKWYWEQTITGSSTLDIGIGLCTEASQKSSATNVRQTGWYNVINGSSGDVGSSANGGANISISTTNWATNDIIMVAYDADTGYIWFGRNGTWYPPTTGGSAGNPAAGTNQTISAVSNLIPASWHYNTNASTAVNFGQRPFSYSVPSGFTALNTFNLPTPTILQGNKYMDANLWTGNGVAQTIVNQAQFKPDLMWTKSRSVNGYYHVLIDSVRGITKALYSNATDAENTLATRITSINSNGYTVGSSGDMNDNAQTFVGWQWQAGQGSSSSNTSGSITSTVSVNTTAGFSVVTYTGTGANATVGHGLGVAPKMVIVKIRNGANNWFVWHTSLTSGAYYLNLDATSAQQSNSVVWNNTIPTSSVFSLGTSSAINGSTNTYVAYCWADVSGYSKAFSYTGNASTDGPFVFCNFRPRFILFKNSSAAATQWIIFDTSRNTYNFVDAQLRPNASDAENSAGSAYSMDILSNGFKVRSADSNFNGSGNTIIGMAFAENPFKNSNAR